MSASLMWSPQRTGKCLPDALRFALQEEYRLGGSAMSLGYESMPFLRGLMAGNVEGARELLDAIDKYDHIEVWLEY